MDTNQNSPNSSEDEITIKELFDIIGKYWDLLWKNKFLFFIILVPIGSLFTYKYIKDIPVYKAEVTFMINEEDGGGVSAIGGLLGQFGLGSASGKFNQNKVPFLVKSDRILRMVLFDTCTIDGKKDFFINFIKNEYQFNKKWSKDSIELADFKFDEPLTDLSSNKSGLYKSITGFVNNEKSPLVNGTFNDDNAIFSISASTSNQDLSIQLANSVFNNLSEYYISKAIERQIETFNLVKFKRDSIESALASVQYSIANFADQNKSTWSSTNNLQRLKLEQERLKLGSMLQEVARNYELADYSLKSQKPFFQVIDRPFAPIKPKQASKVKTLILVFFISGLLFILWIVVKQIIKENT